ncbi:MAG: radical domain protein [Anaerocolumna sp.]|nr:radical domain protein [Anaerocolumna sp.]
MKQFKKIYIEITNVCNLACAFCPTSKRKAEFMDLETFKKIIEDITPYTDYVSFHVKGEPLLHKDLGDFLDICADHKLKVNITTNGTKISEVVGILKTKPALRQINFSVHSFGGTSGEARLVYLNNLIQNAKKLRASTGVLISYRFWNLGGSGRESENEDLLRILEHEYNLAYEIKLTSDNVRGIPIAEKVFVNQDYEFEWPHLDKEEDEGIGFCHGLRNQAAILVDGTVIPCCLDQEGDINLGNIKKTTFTEIIQSERAVNLYNGFSKRQAVEELCRKCGYRRKFSK